MGPTHFALLVVCLAILGPFAAAEEKQQQEEKKDNQRNKRQATVIWTEETLRREFQSVGLQVPVLPSPVTVADALKSPVSAQTAQVLIAAITSVFGSPDADDLQYYQPLLQFFLSGGAYTIILQYNIDVTSYSTVAQLFTAIISDAVQDANVQANSAIFGALQYYAGHIISQGPSPTQTVTIAVDWLTIFSSLDLNAISANPALTEALSNVIEFVSQPAIQPFLKELQGMQINTNADLLSATLQFVALTAQSHEVASAAISLMPYVGVSGVGAIQSGFTIYGYGDFGSGFGSNYQEHVGASMMPKRQHHVVHHKMKPPHRKPGHKVVRPTRHRVTEYLG